MDSIEAAKRLGLIPAHSVAPVARTFPEGPFPLPPSTSSPSLFVRSAGSLAVGCLRVLGAVPVLLSQALLSPFLIPYRFLRRRHTARLRACFTASPFADRLSLEGYYRLRLRLLLQGLRAHGRTVTAGFPRMEAQGEAFYARALASGRPVALLGLHAGPWELLHRLPVAPANRPFAIATAPAFAPALTAFMAEGREGEGKRILWIGGAGPKGLESGLRDILTSKGVLALMVDQVPGPEGDGEYLELWGSIRTPYPGRLLRFLEARGCVFVPISVRLAEGTAVLTYHGAWETAGPEQVRGFLEEAIAAAPDQWNWSYPKIGPIPR